MEYVVSFLLTIHHPVLVATPIKSSGSMEIIFEMIPQCLDKNRIISYGYNRSYAMISIQLL